LGGIDRIISYQQLLDSPKFSFTMHEVLFWALVAFPIVAIVGQWLVTTIKAVRSPLSELPGPWYAPYTNFHLQIGFARGTVWRMVENGHKKYGSIMRLGPRQIWVADKDALKQVIQQIDLPKVIMYAEISREKESAGLFGEVRPPV
jgi:hypothetical protein